MARLNYVELPAVNIGAARAFYEKIFGWSSSEFAATYEAAGTAALDPQRYDWPAGRNPLRSFTSMGTSCSRTH